MKERKPGHVCVISLVNSSGKAVARQTVGTSKGVYPVEFKDLSEGIYIVRAELLKDRFVQDYATETFSVSARNEFGAGGVDREMLGALCAQSNGALLGFDEADPRKAITVPELQIARIVEKKNYPLWNTRLLVAAIVLFFSLEWFIRKRKGLL